MWALESAVTGLTSQLSYFLPVRPCGSRSLSFPICRMGLRAPLSESRVQGSRRREVSGRRFPGWPTTHCPCLSTSWPVRGMVLSVKAAWKAPHTRPGRHGVGVSPIFLALGGWDHAVVSTVSRREPGRTEPQWPALATRSFTHLDFPPFLVSHPRPPRCLLRPLPNTHGASSCSARFARCTWPWRGATLCSETPFGCSGSRGSELFGV